MLCYSICAALMDGPAQPVDIRTLAGLPGRLLFAGGPFDKRIHDRSCKVLKVSSSEILIQPDRWETPLPRSGDSVILEAASHTSLIQCFTIVRSMKEQTLTLRTPCQLHVVQRRRFPRIDCYMGVTLFTEEQSILPLAAQMTNLSVDGAACVVGQPMIPGAALMLDLTPVGLTHPRIKARIIRCSPSPNHLWVIGMQFCDLEPEQEQQLVQYTVGYGCPQSS